MKLRTFPHPWDCVLHGVICFILVVIPCLLGTYLGHRIGNRVGYIAIGVIYTSIIWGMKEFLMDSVPDKKDIFSNLIGIALGVLFILFI